MRNKKADDRNQPASRFVIFGFFSVFFFLSLTIFSQNVPCRWNPKNLQFAGAPKVQAKCLLRPVKPRGILGETLQKLPAPLDKIIGEKVKISKEKLRRFLSANSITENAIGGSLDEDLSFAQLPDGTKVQAIYFLIHDTSSPNYLDKMFPDDINESGWRGNNLSIWQNLPVAHIFVNRSGESTTIVKFSDALPAKKYGTKFARDYLKEAAKGLQIHIELVQPRRSDAAWFTGNDAVAPQIGFTEAQYERLALLYIGASARRKTWLIPAFHAAIDAGIKDAHDDPQNFDLEKFAASLQSLIKRIK